ncbi:probable LRR receptor-like serine/threonine-protein kinase At1g67720 [Phoenix dactylifera]|uniref:Probable LRR receptor-like serine/threonine-protein kinase At1g67720 n=1 Tax=Phoenix dactylifera TaxID=42345 RepID=A0A8B7CE39_PHODC|nr:probable LRR receptor-like serine/threonine-protein kinase At1g67720 [Phoenix dactylifera]
MLPILFLCLLSFPPSLHASDPPPRGYRINCGSQDEDTVGSIKWIADDGFVEAGNISKLNIPNMMPVLSSLRYFPDKSARKYCYLIPVAKGTKYLIRTTYFYGGFDGGNEPPVFDQIVGGMKWSTVNTTENYAKGLASYYEIIMVATRKTMSICLARNEHTVSSPFISALEVEFLEDSIYNSTDFKTYALSTVARHRFGYDGPIAGYPDDPFNRFWEAFKDTNPAVESHWSIASSHFWNFPPQTAFQTALTTSRGKKLIVKWPAMALPAANYYLALYFQDNRSPSAFSWRVFDVSVNEKTFYSGLNVSTAGAVVHGTKWPLSGQTQITLTPDVSSSVGPVINAGELLMMVPLKGRTLGRDVLAMEAIARSFNNPPSDWSGDPCSPPENSWTGVTCSQGKRARVTALNLTNFGLTGSLPNSIAKLSAITSIWLGGNKLSGPIPDMGSLKRLVSLHLENNQLTGSIPSSLGNLGKLREIFLQNNNLEGQIPDSLKRRSGINIQISPGNQIH